MSSVIYDSISKRLERYILDIKFDLNSVRDDLWKIIEQLREQDWLNSVELDELVKKLEDICYELA